ncbi:MAG: ATP-binding protein [Nitrospirota bacterium]|nr:ATP-binding protein [Nitrospirota bacterium]
MDEKILSRKFKPVFENVDAARVAVHTACRERYLQPGSNALIGDLLLAVTEAMNNAVEHSGAKELEIEVIAGPQNLMFRMITSGKRFDPTAGVAFPDLDTAEELPEGGFGRALIAEMVDSVKYEYVEGRNILTLEKIMITKEDRRNGD